MLTRIDRIKLAATAFRQAIELTDRRRLPESFAEFPRGSCGDVTPLLGGYLIDLGFGPFQYVLADPGLDPDTLAQLPSHAWLEEDKLIVDITADQFPKINEKIVVTESSEFHNNLGGTPRHVADYRAYDERTVRILTSAYNEIVKNLDFNDMQVGPA